MKEVSGKKKVRNIVYDTASADDFLSMAFTLFLEDNLPDNCLADKDTAEACICLGVFAWDLAVMETDKRLKPYAGKFHQFLKESDLYKELKKMVGKSFDSLVEGLKENKIEDFPEYHDFIESWHIGEDDQDDYEKKDSFSVHAAGCAADEVDVKDFE